MSASDECVIDEELSFFTTKKMMRYSRPAANGEVRQSKLE